MVCAARHATRSTLQVLHRHALLLRASPRPANTEAVAQDASGLQQIHSMSRVYAQVTFTF
jgi:hypothetical protein